MYSDQTAPYETVIWCHTLYRAHHNFGPEISHSDRVFFLAKFSINHVLNTKTHLKSSFRCSKCLVWFVKFFYTLRLQ